MKKWILGASLSLDFASASEFLSFSAISKNGSKRLIQVLKIEKEEVTYVDLSEELKSKTLNPFDLFTGKEFDEVLGNLKTLEAKKEKTKYSALLSPLTFKKHHLCAGLNYKDHVQESGQKDELVLFPKFGEVVGHNSAVLQKKSPLPELLDYEIELAAVFDRDIHNEEDVKAARAAFMIANDFSDRAPQIYFFGREGKQSSYSFAAAKSKMNYTLVAPLVVIPKDWRKFSQNLEMKLYVNGQLKQSASTAMMSLSIEEMLLMALKSTKDESWPLLGKSGSELDEANALRLLPKNDKGTFYLSQGSLFMTGTPGGTVFQKPKTSQLLAAALKAPFVESSIPTQSFKDKVKLSLINNLSKSGKYLSSGDIVESKIDNLGFLNFTISEKL